MASSVAVNRISWVDYAKGICIILVVLMHSTLGVEKVMGEVSWLNGFITWAKPFRMPDFFLISGLFLASRINRPWSEYIDSKVVHFYYFYLLWMVIQFIFKGYGVYQTDGVAGLSTSFFHGLIEPYGTLWFVYLLPIFFVMTKLLVRVSPLLVILVAVISESLPIATGWIVIDETAARFVYFFVGYWLSVKVFQLAAWLQSQTTTSLLSSLFIWGVFNAWFVNNQLSGLPIFSIALGFIGASAVIAVAILLERSRFANLVRYCGENSIVIYLSFFLFMAASRTAIAKFYPMQDAGLIALLVTFAAVFGPLMLHRLIKNTSLAFLFVRPRWASLPTNLLSWHTQRHEQPAPQIKRPRLSKTKAR